MTTRSRILLQINELHSQVAKILSPEGRDPTRSEYAAALELADAAMELVVSGGLGSDTIIGITCAALQSLCYKPLCHSYADNERYERAMYNRRASLSSPRPTGSGSMTSRIPTRRNNSYDSNSDKEHCDKVEDLIEAIAAVNPGDELFGVLDEPTAAAGDDTTGTPNRKVHWADQVANAPVRRTEEYEGRGQKGCTSTHSGVLYQVRTLLSTLYMLCTRDQSHSAISTKN
ncbi:hypothetical protein AAE478_007004 [Parahypoxylon ruwenzoriense]